MLEFLITIGASELGKAIFEQALRLGQSAAEDYVKDFFKDCLKEGITSAKPEVTKKAVAQALKEFLVLVQNELEDWEIPEAEIRDRYDRPLVQFVKNDLVKPVLGKAFERDCTAIDTIALAETWKNSSFRDKPFPAMPPEFNWQVIGGKYIKKVQKIIRETPELRSLLETELLERIARNTGNISPGFDVTKYRNSLQSSYGVLKLHTIDNTDQQYRMKLWNMFIEPSVREALPPSRHELPTDLKRQLHDQGRIETDLSPDALELYRGEYFQQPLQKAVAAIFDSNRAVILGDPGSGKSTLLQYLALEWVEGKIQTLPLLLELREYAIAPAANFLEFLHSGRGVDWHFDQHQLHEHLQNYPTLIMFDGLDEVFDRSSQSTVIDDIIRFTQQYPKSQIVVTSRIIGYNPEHLQNSGFRHFTIQPLETNEINKFIDRWYTLALGEDTDKVRLAERLKEAIANSKAIANLADNPLLLTMMAILNRRQELPRDRSELYDQSSRVLLHNWDVDHKRLQVPMDAIGRREKQEMLRLVAYEMQAGTEGLKGNAIDAGRLT
ncbi:MAG: NACHT domain-containing protein [Pseudanabaena sp. ELA645]|jgi:GTPase SAR1 family protein